MVPSVNAGVKVSPVPVPPVRSFTITRAEAGLTATRLVANATPATSVLISPMVLAPSRLRHRGWATSPIATITRQPHLTRYGIKKASVLIRISHVVLIGIRTCASEDRTGACSPAGVGSENVVLRRHDRMACIAAFGAGSTVQLGCRSAARTGLAQGVHCLQRDRPPMGVVGVFGQFRQAQRFEQQRNPLAVRSEEHTSELQS